MSNSIKFYEDGTGDGDSEKGEELMDVRHDSGGTLTFRGDYYDIELNDEEADALFSFMAEKFGATIIYES